MAGYKIDHSAFRVLNIVTMVWFSLTFVSILIIGTYCILSPRDIHDTSPDNIERNLINLWWLWGVLPSFALGFIRFVPGWDVDNWKGVRK